jgi:Zn-dependent protease
LFNLIPVWQLDGGRGFRALSRDQRMLSLGVLAAIWYFTDAGMFLLIGLGALYRIFIQKDHSPVGDRMAFMQYVALLITLGALLAGRHAGGPFGR